MPILPFRFLRCISTAAVLLSAPVAAREAAIPAEVAPPSCILHVWPGSNLRSTYLGWLHGGIVDGAVKGREGYKKLPETPLDTLRQRDLLAGIDVASALGLTGFSTVVHDATLDSRTLREVQRPWATEAGPCHAELAVDDAFFQEDVFSGRYLKVIFRFRRFSDGGTTERKFGQIVAEKLVAFPPAPGIDQATGLAELDAAFRKSVTDFGTLLQAGPRKKT